MGRRVHRNDGGAYEVALLDPSGAELLGASTTAKLEDQIVDLKAEVDLAASLRVRISSACASEAWSGCDFLFACSEARFQQCSEISGGEHHRGHDEDDNFTKRVWGFSQYNDGNRESLFVPGGLPCTFSFPGSQSFSCGIAERDDICWVRCIFGASRKGPLRARRDHHAARSRENGYGAIGATT